MASHRKMVAWVMGLVVVSSLALASPSLSKKRDYHSASDASRISWTQLVSKLEGEGYAIRELDMKRDGWKAEVVQGGKRYKLRLDPQGNVTRKKWD